MALGLQAARGPRLSIGRSAGLRRTQTQEKCRPLLRGECEIALRLDQKQKVAKRQTKTPLPEDINVGLWEALRDCRRELAEAGRAAYVIFHDSTLVEMCSVVPRTLDDFSKLSGVGERKLMKYGEAFLAAIRDAEHAPFDSR